MISGIIIDGSNIGKADYVHPVVEALKKLDESLLCLRLENGSYLDWEIRHSGNFAINFLLHPFD